jgi:ferredoxin
MMIVADNLRRFGLKTYRPIVRLLSSSSTTDKVTEYLTKYGITDDKTIVGISKAYGGKVSVSDLKALGEPGLKSLVALVDQAIVKEETGGNTEQIEINISIPHERASIVLKAKEGDTFFDLVQRNDELKSYLECACGGMAACSTCHVIVDDAYWSKLSAAEESEADMIDLAWGAEANSRLGCQIKFTLALDGLRVTIPEKSNNLW